MQLFILCDFYTGDQMVFILKQGPGDFQTTSISLTNNFTLTCDRMLYHVLSIYVSDVSRLYRSGCKLFCDLISQDLYLSFSCELLKKRHSTFIRTLNSNIHHNQFDICIMMSNIHTNAVKKISTSGTLDDLYIQNRILAVWSHMQHIGILSNLLGAISI